MVKKVLKWGKSILSGFTDRSNRLLIDLQFDQKVEGQKSLKAELHRVTKVTKEGSSKAIRYVLYVNSKYFGSRLRVVCSPEEWLKATKSNFSSSFTVHCKETLRTPVILIALKRAIFCKMYMFFCHIKSIQYTQYKRKRPRQYSGAM